MKLLAGVLASWVSAQTSFYDYEQTYYGKSQVAQSAGDSPEVASVARTLGNGRICWSCLEETYTTCLSDTAVRGDAKRHGAVYCQGEDYFCYISERRIIRHNENEWNYENGNPWQDTTDSIDHAELMNGHGDADPSTEVRVQMGCQQPLSCLRQQWQNYQIQMGVAMLQDSVENVDGAYVPVGSQTEVRSGLCRHHYAWEDHASGTHVVNDQWRKFSWMGDTSLDQPGNSKTEKEGWGDRRFGATERHFQRGKGTESVCHHCCDPYLEYDASGCNFVDATAFKALTRVDVAASDTHEANIFLKRPADKASLDWTSAANKPQYHGAFRNPHTQKEKEALTRK